LPRRPAPRLALGLGTITFGLRGPQRFNCLVTLARDAGPVALALRAKGLVRLPSRRAPHARDPRPRPVAARGRDVAEQCEIGADPIGEHGKLADRLAEVEPRKRALDPPASRAAS
jgi:hypothetical protein